MYLKPTSLIFVYILFTTYGSQVEPWHVGSIVTGMLEKLPTARRSDSTFSKSMWSDRLRKFIETKSIIFKYFHI